MLTEKQIERMLSKLKRFEDTLNPMLFKKVAKIDNALAFETLDRLYDIPDDSQMNPVSSGFVWGAEESFCWFKTEFVVPEELDGKNLFVMPHTEGYETLLWVNGKPFGTFCTKIV
ncbi:MAG: alpha-mannosidase, partial [Clostridia bacterium]|nr:alpha-mannosidase [Clostridia bacterium]